MKKGKRAKYDWPTMQHEYVISPAGDDCVTIHSLAVKYGHGTKRFERMVEERSRVEGWVKLRDDHRGEIAGKSREKDVQKVASQRAKMADGAWMIMMMVPGRLRPLAEKMRKAPAKDWMHDPEIKKLSPTDYVNLGKFWLVLKGEAADRVEVEVTDRDRKMAAAYWKARREMAEEEGDDDGSK